MSNIPEPIKRQIRQEAGFGCCKCGFPIIEYHHIVADSQNPEDIMILCPNHHHEATVGAMSQEEQRHLKQNPFNLERGFAAGKLKINQNTPVITFGSNQIIGEGDLIRVDDICLLSSRINDGRLEISLKLYDRDNNLVAEIVNNEWISGDPLPWDLESKYQWIRIRRKLRDIELEIDVRTTPIKIRADLWYNNQNIQLNPNEILINGVLKNIGFQDICFVAGYIKIDTALQKVQTQTNPRFPSISMISEPDVNLRIKKGLRKWNILLRREEREKMNTCEHEFQIDDRGLKRIIHLKCEKCGLVRVRDREAA